MNKLSIVLIISCFAVIFAERPDWYPKDELAVEAKCREENSISPELMTKIWSSRIEDTPQVRNYVMCLGHNKNFYNSEMGFKADRLLVIMKERANMDCKPGFVEGCAEEGKDIEPEDAMLFKIIKCVIVGGEENCKKAE
ncbi:uncharacterized protein LOC101896904 [Musca domestica]|uniref:Uncharacterized protein LOC101896904 n=1 Tax=Musca domestica TaxID=7370 RepID=A0A9J7I8I0_MUSDO|nr:uncharacterized protein LOC101896904 [Musca domestica]